VEDLFRFLIVFGLQAAAIYAVAASGLVVTYATSGIFNFAHGATGMLAAFSYWELWQNRGWPGWLALIVVLFVEAPLLGYLLDRLIMRRLADAATITTIVVTIGLLVSFVSLAGIIWPQGTSTRVLPEFFAGETVSVLGVNVSYHAFVVLGAAVLVAIVLRLVLYRTRLGVAMRAVVDNRELGALNGVDPNRVSSVAWVMGSMLAALAGVLIAPILPQFTPVALTLLVISAYAAAMVGRLRSLPLTFLGDVVLGELE
jgi:branched-chain amino acid transport system permease protein